MTDVPASDPNREGIDLRADGTIHLWLDGRNYQLRRPKGREFRQLRESLQSRIDGINDAVNDANDFKTKLQALAVERAARDEPLMTAEERAEDRDVARRITEHRERVAGEWWVEMIGLLGTLGDLTFDDLPAWTLDTDPTVVLIAHWRSVPSLSGVR